MNAINLIGRHLERGNLPKKLPIEKVDAICSFTGLPIIEGIRNEHLILPTFTDHEYIRYSSGYSSVEAALCISSVIPGNKGFVSLRNFSYLVTEEELKFLKGSDLMAILTSPPTDPFILCATYSNKKHTAYKSIVNFSSNKFTVTTDIGNVMMEREWIRRVLPLCQKWYKIIPGKESTKAQVTYFTKEEILTGSKNHKRIQQYGPKLYFKENKELEKFRNTAQLKLLVHSLNKTHDKN